MISNIIDRRTRPHRWKLVTAIIEPVWADNSCQDPDQSEDTGSPFHYDHRESISLADAVSWAWKIPVPVTLYIYDLGKGIDVASKLTMHSTNEEHHKVQSVLNSWSGHPCSEIVRREHDWDIRLAGVGGVVAGCPWRIIKDGRIAFSDTDDGQRFGLPKPVDGPSLATSLLVGREITSVHVSPTIGDLKINFSGEIAIELFCNSSGYESWNAYVVHGSKRTTVMAKGGGSVIAFDD